MAPTPPAVSGCCATARPPFALERLRFERHSDARATNGRSSAPRPTRRTRRNALLPTPAGRCLLARIYEVFPLLCADCGVEIRILAFMTAAEHVDAILRQLGLPATPRPLSPARGPPQHDFGFDADPGPRRGSSG
jgi:hypothetical protein